MLEQLELGFLDLESNALSTEPCLFVGGFVQEAAGIDFRQGQEETGVDFRQRQEEIFQVKLFCIWLQVVMLVCSSFQAFDLKPNIE